MLVGKVFEERHNVVSAFKSGKKKNNMGNIKSHVASENHSHKQTKNQILQLQPAFSVGLRASMN